MVRGRKPKPTAVKERSGALRKNPQRRNEYEPRPTLGAPRKPSMVAADPIASNEWDSLCEWLDDMGILAKADRSLMIHYVTTYSEWRKYFVIVRDYGVSVPTATGGVTTSPETHQYNKLSDRLLKLLVELGLTPSARSRLKATDVKDDDDPFASLVSRLSGNN